MRIMVLRKTDYEKEKEYRQEHGKTSTNIEHGVSKRALINVNFVVAFVQVSRTLV